METLVTAQHVGERVQVRGYGDGVLRFFGTPHDSQSGTWLGIELDQPLGKVPLLHWRLLILLRMMGALLASGTSSALRITAYSSPFAREKHFYCSAHVHQWHGPVQQRNRKSNWAPAPPSLTQLPLRKKSLLPR